MTQVSSLYLHVPFCQHLCNYCDFYKRKLDPNLDQFGEFHQFLSDSISRHETLLSSNGFSWGELDTVYLGGGTPSLWGVRGAEFFQKILPAKLSYDVEFTMEIDPGTWNTEMLDAWKKIGLNRISIGTQTLNPEFLKVMDRIHSLDDSLNFLSFLQKEPWNFSLDFLLGIPYSSEKKRNIKAELDTLLFYSPKHISLYILNARSKYPHIQNMPEDEYVREEYLFVSEYLKSKGFHHYEVSNFALPGYESRHNQKYWRAQSVAALGPTGTGFLALSREKALRYKWKVSHAEVEIEDLGIKELSLEKTYLALRTSDGIPLQKGMECLFKSWEQQQYAVLDKDQIKLTSLGFLMLDSLMDDLFKWEASWVKSK
jgi:oxygen-independent coproporphyrinogen-3 oxidase